jgi:predicted nuclease of predicted toxin-antitoxin system
MPWQPLDEPEHEPPGWKARTRILVDEALGHEVAAYLRERGFNAVFAPDVGLSGRSDEDIFAFAWRENRMLWTHDRDFLDDNRFPEHRNPGIVVLPGANGDQRAMRIGLATAVLLFGQGPKLWRKSKAVISAEGEITIRNRSADSGRIEATRYRMTRGRAEMLVR